MELMLKIFLKRRKVMMYIAVGLTTAFLLVLIILFGFFTSRDRSVIFTKPQKIKVNNIERAYRISKPKNQVKSVVIGFHGFGDTSLRFAYYTALHNVVSDDVLVIYPEALHSASPSVKAGWNAGFCCGSGFVEDKDDMGFIDQLIENVKVEYGSDVPIFLSGFSNGAFMAMRYAAERPAAVDGFAVSSGAIGTTQTRIEPKKPVPALLMHGEKDTRVAFTGGASDFDPEFVWLSFGDTVEAWERVNAGNVPTQKIIYPNNAHQWDDWRLLNIWHRQPNASKEVAQFLAEIAVN